MTATLVLTFADCGLIQARCCSCSREFPSSAPVEKFKTDASLWATVFCSNCHRWTPLRLEEK